MCSGREITSVVFEGAIACLLCVPSISLDCLPFDLQLMITPYCIVKLSFNYISRGHGVGIFTMAQGMGVYPENYHLRDTPACRGKPRRLYNNTFICSLYLMLHYISIYLRILVSNVISISTDGHTIFLFV
jgi:hypothetical protein